MIEIGLFMDVTWVDHRESVENNRSEEKESWCRKPYDFVIVPGLLFPVDEACETEDSKDEAV